MRWIRCIRGICILGIEIGGWWQKIHSSVIEKIQCCDFSGDVGLETGVEGINIFIFLRENKF